MADRKLTNIDDFMSELEAGIFKDRLALMLTDSALGAVVNNAVGKVKIEFNIKRLNEHGQVMIETKLQHVKPTKRGAIAEHLSSQTPMWVGRGGVVTIEQPKEEITGQFTLVENK
jgi:hypothetical protein